MFARLLSPTAGLIALTVLYALNALGSGLYGAYTSIDSDFAFCLGFSLLLAWWVYVDRRRRNYPAPFEFEAFVFFAWPVVVPYYLIKTRRLRGLLWSLAVIAVVALPEMLYRLANAFHSN